MNPERSTFMKIILLGAPGAGKGTQAEVICNRYNIPAISTGNIIREALKTGTEMGLKAKSYMESGALVPDEVVIGIIKERIVKDDCKDGFILDGFPRTIPQAEALDKMGIVIDKVIDIEVPDEKIINRMSGRRVCEKCGASYHLEYKKPKVEGICDACSGTLIQRKDDHPDTVKSRLDVYHSETEPLKDYYEKQGKLTVVEGQEEIEDTTRLLIEALEA
jgi:adenylate kinase